MGIKTAFAAALLSSWSSILFGTPLVVPFRSGYDPYYGVGSLRNRAEGNFLVEPMNEEANEEANEEETKKNDRYGRSAMDRELDESLDGTIVVSKPKTTWKDVAGLANAKEQLQIAAEMPDRQPQLFQNKRKPHQFILLYGPPGTGKGHLVKALASGVKSTLFTLSASDVTSKWYGESERLVKLLFDRARRHKPCIIFFDEIDALCGKRDRSADHENRVKNEFLVQIDGVDKDNSGILFIAATNLPWTLDEAFRRRFQKKILVPMPDSAARRRLFEIEIGDTQCNLSQADYEQLTEKTDGFSGSDITNLVQEALMGPIRRLHRATHFKQREYDRVKWFWPSKSNEEGAMRMTWREVPKNRVLDLPVLPDDFFDALSRAKSSVDPAELHKFSEWTEKFGMDGA